MASASNSSPMLSWQFVVLLAAAMGAFLSSGRLNSLAPSAVEPANDRGVLVDAHLVDDPFGAWVRAAKKSDAAGEIPFPGFAGAHLPGPIGSDEVVNALVRDKRVCLLPIVVRGDFHSTEAREMRIRFRAAAVSGLGAQGLVADDPEHLLMISPPATWAGGRGRKLPSIFQPMPAEWFVAGGLPRQRASPYGAVLVVWIQDEALFINPLATLDGLRGELSAQISKLLTVDAGKIDFKVIGPYWSGTLIDILAELKGARTAGDSRPGANTIFYSATATMADGMLDLLAAAELSKPAAATSPVRLGPADGPGGRKRISRPEDGPVLVSLACTDEALADALLDELKLRGVNVADESTRIAIVSDWDTEAGRALPLTFAAKLSQLKGLAPGDKTSDADLLPFLSAESYRKLKFDRDGSWPHQILRAYYISGVGGTAGSPDSESKADESEKSGSDSADSKPFERAEGEHQVDYMARLGMVFADRLTERDYPQSARGKSSKPAIPRLRAIGLVGSNVYDELLLLQFLRPRFPDAVFFTDKLDARFFDPAWIKYARNLVVASSYGLELFQKLQVGVAPFRSSEQTGAFLAVQAAMASREPEFDYLRAQLQPLRFEIGRTHPVPLFVPGRIQVSANLDGARFHSRLHPKFDMPLLPGGPFWKHHLYDVMYMMAGAVFFGAMILFIFIGRFRLETSERTDVAAAALLAGSVFALVLAFSVIYDGVEPLAWIEGVSIWPSELLRLVALATAVGGLYYCGSRVRRSRKLLSEEFGLIEAPLILRTRSGFFSAMRDVLARMPLSQDDYLLSEREDDAAVAALRKSGGDYRGAVAAAEEVRRREYAAKPEAPPLRFLSTQVLWRYLCERSTPSRRNARAALMTGFYLVGWCGLFSIIGIPASPFRGGLSWLCDLVLVSLASISMVYLIFWVVDETQSCLRFVSRLGEDNPSIWPEKAFEKIPSIIKTARSQAIMDRKAASAYIEVLFIGRLTAEAVPLIMLPFAVLTWLIFARWTLFANWHMTPSIIAFYGSDAAICALCALLLKTAATKAKNRAVRNIGLNAADARAVGADGFADSLQALQADMEANEEGAFLPWHQQPVVRAVLLPFGGSGVLQAAEFMINKK